MKDTRAGGGAITCKWLKMNELETRVVRFHAEPGFFAGEISPLLTRESTGGAGYIDYISGGADYYILGSPSLYSFLFTSYKVPI